MAWVATTSFETTDGSTAPTDGNDVQGTGSGEGSGFTGNWTDTGGGDAGAWDYDNATAAAGSWSIVDLLGGGDMYRALAASTADGIGSFQVRRDIKTTGNANIRLRNSADATIFLIRFGTSDIELVGATTVTIVSGYSVNTWYRIHFSYASLGATGTVKARENSQSSWTSTVSPSTDAAITRFAGESGVITGSFWIDDIRAGSEPSTAVNTNNLLALTGVG